MMKSPDGTCACGCGEHPTSGHRFVWRHNTKYLAKTRYTRVGYLSDIAVYAPIEPEKNLIAAVLNDAAFHKKVCGVAGCRQCRLDRAWAMNTAAWGLYAFTNICEHLGLEWAQTRQWFLATAR